MSIVIEICQNAKKGCPIITNNDGYFYSLPLLCKI